MPPQLYAKLRVNILDTWTTTQTIPPIVARACEPPHPDKWEIVDGYHRWKILKEEGIQEIPVMYLGTLPKAQAQRLCLTLNYLRGDPDPKKYTAVLGEIMMSEEWGPDDLAHYLPESPEAIVDMMSLFGSESLTMSWDNQQVDDEFLAQMREGEEPRDQETKREVEAIVEITLQLPVSLARRVENARSTLFDLLYDPDQAPPNVDELYARLTAILISRYIHTQEDIFDILSTA